ncbi:MAG: hypothetical protein E7406_06075 [Ruminococcaceae bacterium]|nr:hypothetical protein [Oscillospiraceae bacterium]
MNNKSVVAAMMFMLSSMLLSGCSQIGEKTTSVSIIYLITTLLSLALLAGYFLSMKKKDGWFIVLFVSVFVVNSGYFSLSVSDTLNGALWANRISYLGSVFLPLSMIMIIFNVTKTNYKKWVSILLISISAIVFFVAASPGYLDIYYKSVTLGKVNGVSVLNKEYGPWHTVYLFYLLGYFILMATVAVKAFLKKKIESTVHAVILIVSVFVNICVWLLEQFVNIDFEFLSVSYIITELFLISVYLMIQYQEDFIKSLSKKAVTSSKESGKTFENNSPEFIEHCNFMAENLHCLTNSERAILNCYMDGMSTKEVLSKMNITENTLKFHNKNLYGKLGVSSRKELLMYAKEINREKA